MYTLTRPHTLLTASPTRFATKWEGTDLPTVTQQRWLPDKPPFSWAGFGWPLIGHPLGPLQTRTQTKGLPSTLLWLAFHQRGSPTAPTAAAAAAAVPAAAAAAAVPAAPAGGAPGRAVPAQGLLQPYVDAARPERLHALLKHSVGAMRWLHDGMVALGHASTHPHRLFVQKHPVPIPSPSAAAQSTHSAAGADTAAAADEMCSTARNAALLTRHTEIQGWLVDRVCLRTPLQRAVEESCTLVRVLQPGEEQGPAAAPTPRVRGRGRGRG